MWRSCHAACAYTFVAMLPRLGGRTEASASAGSVAMLPFALAWLATDACAMRVVGS